MRPFKEIIRDESLAHLAKLLQEKKIMTLGKQLSSLSLKERMLLVSENLPTSLSKDDLLKIMVPLAHLQETKDLFSLNEKGLQGFLLWPLGLYVEKNFKTKEKLRDAFFLLEEITKRFTSEFFIRSFMDDFPLETKKRLFMWATSNNHHLRRLASEGSRPFLPWGKKLKEDTFSFQESIHLLKILSQDSSLYVQKSVCNHLNDLSRLSPQNLMKAIPSLNLSEIQKRKALRSLIKKGDSSALQLVGIKKDKSCSLESWSFTPRHLQLNETLFFHASLKNKQHKEQKIIIHLVFSFLQQNNQWGKNKIFKVRELILAPLEERPLTFSWTMKEVTTRKYYPGKQKIALQFNGEMSEIKFFSFSKK